MNGAAAIRAFIDAFNAEDLDALVATLSDDVEIQASRGLVEGRAEARDWATRRPSGELAQRLVIEEVAEHGAHVIATVRREWVWREGGEVADSERIFYVATLRDGLICRWAPFASYEEAVQAAGGAPDLHH
jgi:hypothetical protein